MSEVGEGISGPVRSDLHNLSDCMLAGNESGPTSRHFLRTEPETGSPDAVIVKVNRPASHQPIYHPPLQGDLMVTAIEVVHGVDGHHNQRVLAKLFVGDPDTEIQNSTAVDHFAKNLVNVIAVFASPF